MQSDFLAKVHTMYNQFTKAEKKVADFYPAESEESSFYVNHGTGG